ncbi:MAG: UvrD-helicase domain-containing protein [Acidobacteriota bacterium]|nr:UvrD-helicase domain-containing protein [Blastocatellia bacterium]MDW8240984.1 UvrD-helicase domain-containing protein [Acidobacteriota bacterium]
MRRYVLKRPTTQRLRVDYRAELNDQQYAAVAAGAGPLLVIAGAGSGKTRVVTYRVAWLIEHGVDPSRILLVTFTNKAAREMLRRVEALLQTSLPQLWGGTFHHIANRVLREHAELLGYTPNYTILDAEDSRDLISLCVREAGIDIKARRFPRGEVLGDIISLAANTSSSIEQVIERSYPYFEPLTLDIALVSAIYRQRKQRDNLMDYDDLLLNWKRLLDEHPTIHHRYANQFMHILVDEYQDTNAIQADIVDQLAVVHRNVMVVGDDAQSIYSWRGANFRNIYEFPARYPDAQVVRLEVNYRSTPPVLELANASIACNQKQFPKALRARRRGGVKPALIPARDVYEQADFVVSRALELRDAGIPLSEMAVLYRSHYHSMEIQVELVRRGIPYLVRSGVRFFEQAHIKDVLAYVRLVSNPYDELAWMRVLQLIPGVGKNTATRVWQQLTATGDPLTAVTTLGLVPARAEAGWKEFISLVARLTDVQHIDSPSAQIEAVLDSGYVDHVRANYANAEARLDDLRQLATFAARYQSAEAFLSEVALIGTERFSWRDGLHGEDVMQSGDPEEFLVLSSIHQAKGLEWRVVFLVWAAHGRFPSARALQDEESIEEERRLFYVAVTRAKDELYLCYPLLARERHRTLILSPSLFIQEVDPSLMDEWMITVEPFDEHA